MSRMHWLVLVDEEGTYLIGDVCNEPVALKVTYSERIPHAELADLVVTTLNLADNLLDGGAGRVSQVIAATNEGRAQ